MEFLIWPIVLIVLILFVLIVIVSNIKIVPQASVYVVERLGSYFATWETGLHVKVPFFDSIAKKVSLKEQVVDFAPQPVITKDNVTMQIDTVVFYQVTDAKLFTYGVERPLSAIENLTATTLRNIIGEMELDSTLTSRDVINSKITATLDEATDKWGIKVNRVELKNILPPREIQDAMEKQMKAERERRESILRAEGENAARSLWRKVRRNPRSCAPKRKNSPRSCVPKVSRNRKSVRRRARRKPSRWFRKRTPTRGAS